MSGLIDPVIDNIVILPIAYAKVTPVAYEFMDIRHAPLAFRAGMLGVITLVGLTIVTLTPLDVTSASDAHDFRRSPGPGHPLDVR